MTEAGWLACTDPRPMSAWLGDGELLTDRKQRLLDCACVRRVWRLLTDERGRRAVELAESFADGMTTPEELREAQAAVFAAANVRIARSLPGQPDSHTVLSAAAGAAWEYRSGADPLADAAIAIAWEGLTGNGLAEQRLAKARVGEEWKAQAVLLRDIFGNPFRPVSLDLRWLTSPVLGLARTMYESRDFAAMPILADALGEAGCDDPDVLTHCRGGGPHVRGCWVVDLVLGKT